MPIDYKKYPANWKTEIRPSILERARNCCEICGVENYMGIIRGTYGGVEVWEDINSNVYLYPTGEFVGNIDESGCYIDYPDDRKGITIILTIAHLDHDITNNDPTNLKALCQKCHNRHDAKYRAQNRKKNKNQLTFF